jgi:hypothetical protein
LKSKLILSGLFLTGAVSCASFKPFVLTDAFINPQSTTEVTYEDLNFSYALFNQYASGLSYKFRIDYSTYHASINNSISIADNIGFTTFSNWSTPTGTFIEGVPDASFTTRLNRILFGRQFDDTTKKSLTNHFLNITRRSAANTVNYSVIVESRISYSVNIGSVYQAFRHSPGLGIDQYAKYILFYDKDDNILQTVLLDTDRTNVNRNYLYNLSTVITNVRKFELLYAWVDFPPFATADADLLIYEFNIFTQNQEIKIPDDAGGDRFGFEFVAVEWWDILGHLQNFAWWIVNQSPVAPVFEWIEDYVITWVSGLITFITGVFRL